MTHYHFTPQRALEYIASASAPVSKKDILAFFKQDENTESRLDETLRDLTERKLIAKEFGKTAYSAKAPYADTVYATLTSRKKGRKCYLDIWGLPKGSEYQATLSDKQINANKLETGDVVVINITSGKGLERAANFLKKCDGKKPVHIQGYFNERSNGRPAFEAANRNIKTQFKLQNGAPDFATEHRGVYDALLPLDMRIDDPQIALMEDNGIDLDTGADINTVLLKKHGIPHRFSSTASMEASTLQNRAFSKSKRKDMTDRDFITIDPPGAQDLDDATCVERIDGGWRLTVAIADIDEFVTEGTALDRESYIKGTTFYLPERNYTLYPHELTMRCSLLLDQERPAGIYEAFFDDNMVLQSESTGLGIIRTRAQLSYDQYHELLDKGDKRVRVFDEFHQRLREKFWEAQTGRQLANQILRNQYSGYISHGFVETAMVMANQGIARELDAAGISVPFRNHGPMVHPESYKKMAKELNYLGFEISDNPYNCNWATLDDILKQAENRGIKPRVEEVLSNDFFDRSYYEPSSRGHFALGIKHYCHATSPLRRKADSYVWRGVRTLHGIKKGALSEGEAKRMPEICEQLQTSNQLAKDIESDRNKWRLIKTLNSGDERRATILHVNTKSVEIMLGNGLRNRLSDEMLKAGGWDIDSENRQIVRTSNGDEERLGRDQHLRGKIESVKPLQALWSFTPSSTPDNGEPDLSPD